MPRNVELAASMWTRITCLVAASLMAALLNTVIPDRAWAVICSNGGARPDPAGIDGGGANNTACGVSANASGVSTNSAYGFQATANGQTSDNTGTGANSNASGDGSSRVVAVVSACCGSGPRKRCCDRERLVRERQ